MNKSIVLAILFVAAASSLPAPPQSNEQTLSKIADLLAELRQKNNQENQVPQNTQKGNNEKNSVDIGDNKTKAGPSMAESASGLIKLLRTKGTPGLTTRNGMEIMAHLLGGAASLLFKPYAEMVQGFLLSPALLKAVSQVLESYNKV